MRTTMALAAGALMLLSAAILPTTASAQSSAQCTQWKALAWNNRGDYVYKCYADNEDQLKRETKMACEHKWGRTCGAIAVPSTWKMALVHCMRQEGSTVLYNAFAGGSAEAGEVEIAFRKAERGGYPRTTCKIRGRY
jgi:hypothetical protein